MADIFPSHVRILAFVLVLGGLCLFDLPKPPAERTRVHQYGFILLLGLVGAVFGLINDTITSAISPDYFVLAKGIPQNGAFQRQVWWLGAQAGFAAFAFLGVILMIVNPFKPDMRPVGRRLWLPILLSVLLAVLCGWIQSQGFFFRPMSPSLADPQRLERFQIVWASHAGLYFGGLLGVIIVIWQLFTNKPQLSGSLNST